MQLSGSYLINNVINSEYNVIKDWDGAFDLKDERAVMLYFDDIKEKMIETFTKDNFDIAKEAMMETMKQLGGFFVGTKTIGGHTFESLSKETKAYIINAYQELDMKAELKYPGYKEKTGMMVKELLEQGKGSLKMGYEKFKNWTLSNNQK